MRAPAFANRRAELGRVAESPVGQRSNRNGNGQIVPTSAGLVRGSAGLAGFGREAASEPELYEGRELGRRFEVDAAAVTAVATGGTALWHDFSRRQATMPSPPSPAATSISASSINARHLPSPEKKRGLTAPMHDGRTDLPGRQHRDVLAVAAGAEGNDPSVRAKSVWSRPRPTLVPG